VGDFRRRQAATGQVQPRQQARIRRTAAQLPGLAARAALAMLAWWMLALASPAVAQLPLPDLSMPDLGLVRRLPPVPLAEKLADNLIGTLRPEEEQPGEPPLELMPEDQSPFRKALDLPAGEPLDIDEPSPLEIAVDDLPELPKPPKIWSGRIQLGLNGTSGNSEQSDLRLAGNIKRETDRSVFKFDSVYTMGTANGEIDEDQLLLESRYEHSFAMTRWYGFIHGTTEYDAFTDWELRVTGDGGISYKLIRNEKTQLQLRIGWGAMKEIGPPDAEWVPEGSYGYEFSHQMWKRHKLTAKTDIYFDMGNYSNYRARSDAGWEMKIDQEGHLSFRLSGIHRYDSTPGTSKPSDLTYAALLVWDF